MNALLLGLVLLAQTVEPKIVGPEKIAAGRLAVFSIDCPDGAKAAWRVFPPEQSGLTQTDCAASFEQQRKLAFASPIPGTYRIVAAVSYGDELYLLDVALLVEAASPPSPPPGPPGPGPTPPSPSGWADWAKRVAAETVSEPFRRTEGPTVAKALRSVIDAIAAGRITEPRKARETVRQAVRESLGTMEAINRWESFSNAVDEKMDAEQETLKSLSDYARVWSEIASGLEAQ